MEKYNYNGITNKREQLFASEVTEDIYDLANKAEVLLGNLITTRFELNGECVRNDTASCYDFLHSYEVIQMQLHIISEYLFEICGHIELINGVQSNRTRYLLNKFHSLASLIELKGKDYGEND